MRCVTVETTERPPSVTTDGDGALTLSGHTGHVTCVAASDDGHIVTGSQDTTVAIKPPLCRRIRCCLLRSRHDIVRAFDRRPPAPEAVQGMEIEDVD